MINSNERKRGAILSYLSIILSTVVQLVYTPLLIRMLGQSEYGLYSLVSSVIGYLTVLDLGFGNAIVVFTAKYRANKQYEKEKKLHGMFLVIFCIIGLIAGLLGLLLYFNVPLLFGKTMTDIELHKAKMMIPLLFLGYKSITMTVVITVVNIIVLLSNYFYCKKKLGVNIKFMGFDKKLFKTIFSYSFFIFLGVIVDKVNWNVDQFVLGAVSGTIAVSLYSVASQINTLFVNLSGAISGVLLPKMSKMIAKNVSNKEITNEFIKVGRIQYLIIFLMASGFTLFGKEFIMAWAGKDFATSYYIAVILILPLCVPLIQNLGISIMQAKNMHKFRSILLALIAVANIFISIPLAKAYGGIGSAIGTSLSLIIGNIIILNIYYHKKVGINVIEFWKSIIKMTIPMIIPIVAIVILMHFATLHGYVNLIVFGGIYTILYCLTCYFLVMDDYEKNIVNKVLIKLHLKRA